MGTKKNSQKKVTKPVTKPVVEEKEQKTPEAPATASEKPEETPAEAPTPEVKVEGPEPENPKVVEPDKKETLKAKDKPVENPTPHVDNNIIVPEVVNSSENKEEPKPTLTGSVGANLASFGDPKDRLDKNHQIDLMKMIHQEYIANPISDNKICIVAKQQFDVMALISMVQYNTQLNSDFQTLGITVTPKMAPIIENMAMELLGIKVTTLPSTGDPKQLMLQFESVPKEVKLSVEKEAKIKEIPIPDPVPEMPDKEKLEAIRNILNQKNSGGLGSNLLRSIEWGRKAFSFPQEEKKAVVLANLIAKGVDSTGLICLRGMVTGKLNSEHSILGAHALLKAWCQQLPDVEVAELLQVITSYAIEKRTSEWNERAGNGVSKSSIENEMVLVNRNISAANVASVIDAILAGKDDTVVDYPDKTGKLNIHPSNIRKTFVAAYGDSESLLKDKLNEVVKYYATPILRLSNYADKSAYSKK